MINDSRFALLIAGSEEDQKFATRFEKNISLFEKHLAEEAGLDPDRIQTISYARPGIYAPVLHSVAEFFERVNREDPQGDVVVVYCGHGLDGGFVPNGFTVSYEKLGLAITHEGKFLFINASCHSGSAIREFKRLGLLPHKGSVVAECGEDERAPVHETFLTKLLGTYRQRKPFRRRKMGSFEVDGKIVFRTPEDATTHITDVYGVTVEVANALDQPEYVKFKSPVIQGDVQHPQRCGVSLDHLLYSRQ